MTPEAVTRRFYTGGSVAFPIGVPWANDDWPGIVVASTSVVWPCLLRIAALTGTGLLMGKSYQYVSKKELVSVVFKIGAFRNVMQVTAVNSCRTVEVSRDEATHLVVLQASAADFLRFRHGLFLRRFLFFLLDRITV